MRKLAANSLTVLLALLVFGLLGFAQTSSTTSANKQSSDTSSAQSSNTSNAKMNSTDQNFVTQAAQDGMGEVAIVKVAEQKATDPQVKNLAKKLLDDHNKADDQLKDIASKQDITLPSDMSQQDKDRVDRLSKLSGKQFDQAFLKEQVKDHQKDIQAFQNEANNGQDPQLKQWAQNKLSVLRDHLQMAQKLAKQEGVATASTSRY